MSDQATDGQIAERVRKAMAELLASIEDARAAGLSVMIFHPMLASGMARYVNAAPVLSNEPFVEITRRIEVKL